MYAKRTQFLMALVISLAAFAAGQVREGAGVLLVVLATTLWTAHAARRARSFGDRGSGASS